MFSDIKEYAKQNDVPITKDDTMQFIVDYINTNKIKSILEIGTAIAYGSINMAMCDSVDMLDTVEISAENYNQAVLNIEKYGLRQKINTHFINANSILIIATKSMT